MLSTEQHSTSHQLVAFQRLAYVPTSRLTHTPPSMDFPLIVCELKEVVGILVVQYVVLTLSIFTYTLHTRVFSWLIPIHRTARICREDLRLREVTRGETRFPGQPPRSRIGTDPTSGAILAQPPWAQARQDCRNSNGILTHHSYTSLRARPRSFGFFKHLVPGTTQENLCRDRYGLARIACGLG